MTLTGQDFDPFAHDPTRWATSMRNHAELLLGTLTAAGVRSVVEVGAFAGDLTSLLVDWAAANGATVGAVDPMPQPALVELDRTTPELELIRETSIDALARIELPDAIVIDGDHNWFTVSEELRLIAERADELPLLLFHDVCWPHGRRDDYYAPDQIPAGLVQPLMPAGEGIVPGDPGSRRGGLPYPKSAAREGGEHNGVLTAVEDFAAARDDVRLVVVPIFFGFGVLWRTGASYAAALAELLDPWDRNPTVARLEQNRVHHLAEAWQLKERVARQEEVLQRLLDSRAITLAERISRLRDRVGIGRGATIVAKDEIRRALDG